MLFRNWKQIVLFFLTPALWATVPQNEKKRDSESLITPEIHIEYYRQADHFPKKAPPQVLIYCYSESFLKKVLKEHKHEQCDEFTRVYFLTDYPGAAIAFFGVGAPQAAKTLEFMIAWGTKNFISIGLAGGIQKELNIGDFVVCDRAIRDEGTSHHYLPDGKWAFPTKTMTQKLEEALAQSNVPFMKGAAWTTDAFYRQTVEEVKQYQAEGILCVEMEAAALFSVASLYPDVQMGAIFTISDSYADLEWKPAFRHDKTQEGMKILLQAALQTASSFN